VNFYYPLRDLFKKELVTYVSTIVEPRLLPLCVGYEHQPRYTQAAATSARNITVDELFTQYFESMQGQFPHIVSNVVRTAARLVPGDEGVKACRICGLPGDGGGGMEVLGSVVSDREKNGEGKEGMCYACSRSTHDVAGELAWPLDR
jgi:cytoplasmic tRNA 2-thiolation protein 2